MAEFVELRFTKDFLKMASPTSTVTVDSVLMARMASKFRGCLTGALLGDCLGATYEFEEEIFKGQLQRYFDKLDGPYFKAPYKPYTDDTAMSKCIAESLIEKKGFDGVDLAKRFVREYFQDPRRGYGANVTTVFHKLKGTKFADPFGPAREQFDGLGSLGNGAAMRVAPVALFCYNNLNNLLDVTKKASEITHTHALGVNGAILQTLAIRKCLFLNPKDGLNINKYTDELIEEMVKVEKDQDDFNTDAEHNYEKQLGIMKELLNKTEHPSDDQVVNKLGHSVAALYSVPTAVYSFLKAQNEIPEIETDNPFRRTLQYAISLGGDTDTIASMAGAIAGAYYGYDIIGETLQKHCEKTDEIIKLADNLFEIASV